MIEKRGDFVSCFYRNYKKGQLTIFILLAIVIVVGIFLFFLLKQRGAITEEIPTTFKPIEGYYLDCVKEYASIGISILEENGGYIYFSKFEPGNDYSPTSNQLDFFGTGIPFWYYASASNLIKEQVPTKQELENQLKKYLDENLKCDFSLFQQQGYAVNLSKPKIDVKIEEN